VARQLATALKGAQVEEAEAVNAVPTATEGFGFAIETKKIATQKSVKSKHKSKEVRS
jgi:hypothetical protein